MSRSCRIPLEELEWRFSASGGPGGQHANTANTRAEVRFDVAGSPSLGPRQRARLLARLGPAVRVVASDERANAGGALAHELATAPLLVDNRRPEVADLKSDGTTLSGAARDAQSPIAELSLSIEGGSAEPFELTVPAQGRFTLVANQQDRIPKGKAHAATIRSVNGVGVVAEETIDSIAPSPRRGFSASAGANRGARTWVLAAGAATETSDEWVTVQNVATRETRVSIYSLARGQRIAVEGLQGIRVPAGTRRAIRISDHLRRDGLTLLVEADRPIVAARTLYQVGGPGISSTPGVILR